MVFVYVITLKWQCGLKSLEVSCIPCRFEGVAVRQGLDVKPSKMV